MKRIEVFETAEESGKEFDELKINCTLYSAYMTAREIGNELIDFCEVIWETDIQPIVEECRELGIEKFTISSTFSRLLPTIAEFEKQGYKMAGLTQVKSRCTDWHTGKPAIIPAILMSLEGKEERS